MFRISIGIMNGEMRPGPFASRILCCSSTVASPPMPEPRKTPTSSRLTCSKSSPESLSAPQPAWTPKWVKRSVRRTSFGLGNAGVGSKFFTSAAIWQS